MIYFLVLGMELVRIAGSGDEGIDGIGLAPICPVVGIEAGGCAAREVDDVV